jgi:hypothetical protein
MAVSFPNPFEVGQTNYGLSPRVWLGIPRVGDGLGAHSHFAFRKYDFPVGDLTATQATAGTCTYIDTVDGFGTIMVADADSTTNTQGINIQDKQVSVNAKNGMIVAWETMTRAHDIATVPELFWGLSDVDTTIIASGAITTGYRVGFYTVSAGLLCVAGNNATPTATASTVHTLVDADVTTDGTEWVRLGVRAEVGRDLQFFVNGAKVASELAASLFPIGAAIVPSHVVQTNGTVDPLTHSAWHAMGWTYA